MRAKFIYEAIGELKPKFLNERYSFYDNFPVYKESLKVLKELWKRGIKAKLEKNNVTDRVIHLSIDKLANEYLVIYSVKKGDEKFSDPIEDKWSIIKNQDFIIKNKESNEILNIILNLLNSNSKIIKEHFFSYLNILEQDSEKNKKNKLKSINDIIISKLPDNWIDEDMLEILYRNYWYIRVFEDLVKNYKTLKTKKDLKDQFQLHDWIINNTSNWIKNDILAWTSPHNLTFMTKRSIENMDNHREFLIQYRDLLKGPTYLNGVLKIPGYVAISQEELDSIIEEIIITSI